MRDAGACDGVSECNQCHAVVVLSARGKRCSCKGKHGSPWTTEALDRFKDRNVRVPK